MTKRALKSRPRYSKAQKETNRRFVEAIVNRRDGWDPVWRTPIHVTLMFGNGRRIECYPSMIGLHNQGSWLRYFQITDIEEEIYRLASLEPVHREPVEDDFALIDEEDSQ